ncbi:unnamed protein product [Rhizopus microsporus]|uniref:Uncharacterized protein n=1 Tax=Rhizopus microsporus TaxID=58291 RepID=A0A1X0SAF8_RHIZD|nr:hypothetical protein BCV71DRAFT_261278 [Rhizopus microsporus]
MTEDSQFPLPSFCLYSKKALTSEIDSESDIIQFLSPSTDYLKERLPMFVSILQSLFTVVHDMPFSHTTAEEETEEEEMNDLEDEEEDDTTWSPFTIIGLNSMKMVVWPNMCDQIQDNMIEKDLCLVIMLSSDLQDDEIIHNMNLVKNSLCDTYYTLTGQQLGEELIPLIKCWFDRP